MAGRDRQDFEPGHTLSLVHGAYSARAVAERAQQVHERLLEVCPYLAEDRYAPSVDRYAKASAREALAHEALVSMEPGARGFTRLVETATAASRLAWVMGDALGLTPGGHAKLQMLVAGAAEAAAGDPVAKVRAHIERVGRDGNGND